MRKQDQLIKKSNETELNKEGRRNKMEDIEEELDGEGELLGKGKKGRERN